MRHAIVSVALAFLVAVPAGAQDGPQQALQARYDRALAAGYKALFLCSAISSAERAGAQRSADNVAAWELTGIQAPLDAMIADLPHNIERRPDGTLDYVAVGFDDAGAARHARHLPGKGCHALPIGAAPPVRSAAPVAAPQWIAFRSEKFAYSEGIGEVLSSALANTYGEGTRTTVTLVTRNGRTVAHASAPDFPAAAPQRTWSVAKSIAATLVGAAVQRGEVDVAASAGLGFAADDPRRAITIDHVLRMASGRYQDTPGNRTDALYFGGSTVAETALHWPLLHAPGTAFRYANNDTLAAVMAIDAGFAAHPPSELFGKLGMINTVAETDWQGDYILSSQVWSTADDLARLGQLYLDDGVLPSGERVLPAGWATYVAAPAGPQPDGPFGYGAGFWLLNKSEGIPPDTYAMFGNRGQYVVIVPACDMVIVRRGEDPVGTRFDIAAFARDVLRESKCSAKQVTR